MIEEKLLEIKKGIEEAKTEVAQLQGRLDGLFEQLNSVANVKTIAQASKLLEQLDKELAKEEIDLENRVNILSKKYTGN